MNSQLMSPKDFAAHRGVQKSAVSNWKKRDLLVYAEGPGGKMMIDVARSEARINARLDPTRGRPTTAQAASAPQPLFERNASPERAPGNGSDELSSVRIDLLKAQTTEKNLKNAKMAAELVLLADYESRSAEYGRLVRERMQSMIRNLAERLAAEREPRNVIALLSVESDAVLDDLAVRMLSRPVARDEAEDDAPEIEDEILDEPPPGP